MRKLVLVLVAVFAIAVAAGVSHASSEHQRGEKLVGSSAWLCDNSWTECSSIFVEEKKVHDIWRDMSNVKWTEAQLCRTDYLCVGGCVQVGGGGCQSIDPALIENIGTSSFHAWFDGSSYSFDAESPSDVGRQSNNYRNNAPKKSRFNTRSRGSYEYGSSVFKTMTGYGTTYKDTRRTYEFYP